MGYGDRMMDTNAQSSAGDEIGAMLREELARGDVMAETVVPILRHLLAANVNSVFSDEVLARVRGMARSIAEQLLDAFSVARGDALPADHGEPAIAAVVDNLFVNPGFLGHLHSLALEWQLAERLEVRSATDPVLSPLLQALIASSDRATASLAIEFLASQVRFVQSQRRMKLALNELPGDLLHTALVSLRTFAGIEADANQIAAKAEEAIRKNYSEAESRLGIITQIIMNMGAGVIAALSMTHAGVAIFLSALAIGSGQTREAVVLSTNEAQFARFALSLRSAGLRPAGVEEQLMTLHPEMSLPKGFDRIGADYAAAMLAVEASFIGG